MAMHSPTSRTRAFLTAAIAAAIAGAGLVAHPFALQATQAPKTTPAPAAKPAAAPGGKTFATPELALQAAIEAATAGPAALLALLGPDGKDLVNSGDAVQDQKDRDNFVRLAREKTAWIKDPAIPSA
jgi:hypothetical protein